MTIERLVPSSSAFLQLPASTQDSVNASVDRYQFNFALSFYLLRTFAATPLSFSIMKSDNFWFLPRERGRLRRSA